MNKFNPDSIRRAMRLYVIPDREIGAPRSIEEQTLLAVNAGATCIQLRDKPQTEGHEPFSGGKLCEVASKMLEICRARRVLFAVNDRVDVALAVGADGVHIGQSDSPLRLVRKIVPTDFIVGVSVRTEEELYEAQGSADYLGFGAVFPTGSKEDAKVIGLNGLKILASKTSLPSVAIGGINASNIGEILATGVGGAAVISAAVCGDITQNIKTLSGKLL